MDLSQLSAVRRGDTVQLRLLRDARALAELRIDAPPLDRLLAMVAADKITPAAAGVTLAHQEPLRQAVLNLTGAQTGDVAVDTLAGRDVITINVFVGNDRHGE